MARNEEKISLREEAIETLQEAAFKAAREVLSNQEEGSVRAKKAAAQKLYLLAKEIAERELKEEEVQENAD